MDAFVEVVVLVGLFAIITPLPPLPPQPLFEPIDEFVELRVVNLGTLYGSDNGWPSPPLFGDGDDDDNAVCDMILLLLLLLVELKLDKFCNVADAGSTLIFNFGIASCV